MPAKLKNENATLIWLTEPEASEPHTSAEQQCEEMFTQSNLKDDRLGYITNLRSTGCDCTHDNVLKLLLQELLALKYGWDAAVPCELQTRQCTY